MTLPLRLGPLGGEGYRVSRSGVTWLCEDGHQCRAREVVAFCNLTVEASGRLQLGAQPFAGERALQVGLAPRVAGRLRIDPDASSAAHLNVFRVHPWEPGQVIAHLEAADDSVVGGGRGEPGELDLLMLAGRRMTWALDVPSGLLPGWHSRARGWWTDGGAPGPTLISLGFCDATSVVRGDSAAFVEMFEAAPFAAQMAHVSEHPATPCAPFLLEQFLRTPAEREAIGADLMRGLGRGDPAPTPDDWIFAGALLTQLNHSPLREGFDVLTAGGLTRQAAPQAAMLSLGAEPSAILRHKTLDYCLVVLSHDMRAAGPAVRAWMNTSFEVVRRSLDDIRRDFGRLIDAVGAATGARFLVLNQMSSNGREDISSYAPFDAPMSETLSMIAAKELNLMLHDLADERDVDIIDIDAMAAEVGGAVHVPDGVHLSGALQALARSEVLEVLARL